MRYLRESGNLEQKTLERMRAELIEILNSHVTQAAGRALAEEGAGDLVRRMADREIDPHSAAEEMVEHLFGGGD